MIKNLKAYFNLKRSTLGSEPPAGGGREFSAFCYQDRQEKEATLPSPVSRIGGGGVRDEVTKRNLWFYVHAMSPFQAARGAKPHPTGFQAALTFRAGRKLVFCGPRARPWDDRFCPFRAEDAWGRGGLGYRGRTCPGGRGAGSPYCGSFFPKGGILASWANRRLTKRRNY